MAKGDVVSATSSGTTLTFQPASGVEVMITFVAGDQGTSNGNSGSSCGITDGTDACNINNSSGGYYNYGGNGTSRAFGYGYNNGGNQRIPITNARYLTITNLSSKAGYSGIQIK
jgi:hypothetical protein